MTKLAHEVGALVYLDAVHHAPHLAMDVTAWDCDFVCCSAYKFFGPHVGVLYGKRHLLERLPAYKVRPSPETLPDRWMTGTQNFAAISGVGAAVEYLASIGRLTGAVSDRRTSLLAAFAVIEAYESQIGSFLIDGLKALKKLKVYGITDSNRSHERGPTSSFTHATKTPAQVSEFLAERDIFVWSGNYYALSLTEALGLEPQGMVRVGLLHYNTKDDAEQLLEALSQLE
jgi:selenocysteine lyase/cysteine desulfurase